MKYIKNFNEFLFEKKNIEESLIETPKEYRKKQSALYLAYRNLIKSATKIKDPKKVVELADKVANYPIVKDYVEKENIKYTEKLGPKFDAQLYLRRIADILDNYVITPLYNVGDIKLKAEFQKDFTEDIGKDIEKWYDIFKKDGLL